MDSKLIDPHLDKIPADAVELTPAEREKQLKENPIRGLSINDTIARQANLSVGARGVDTSGVEAGEAEPAESPIATTSDDKLS
jgi:hypothetical protein